MRFLLRLGGQREVRRARSDALVLYPAPRLLVEWPPRWAELPGNLAALLAPSRVTPAMLEGFTVPLRPGSLRPRSLASSLLFHLAALVVLGSLAPLLGRRAATAEQLAALRQQKITWYYYSHELPPIAPDEPGGGKQPSERGGQRSAPAPLGATAWPSPQVIISHPPRPDNARQTIVQPEAPDIRIPQDVRLPNVVMWASSPQKPALEYLPPPELRLQQTPRLLLPPDIAPPVPPVDLVRRDVTKLKLPQLGAPAVQPPVPQLPHLEQRISDLKIAASEALVPEPRLPLSPATIARLAKANAASADDGAASSPAEPPAPPAVAAGASSSGLERLIAIGTDPAPPAGEISVPRGNRAGSFSIGPSGKTPGTPAGSAAGVQGGGAGGPAPAGEGAGQGPADGPGVGGARQLAEIRVPGLSVSGGLRPPSASLGPIVAGPPPASAPRSPGPVKPANPKALSALLARAMRPPTSLPEWNSGNHREQGFLYGKKVYTVYINMPNLGSQSGSWIMRFSELSDRMPGVNEPELTAPVALRKVDPAYDPDAMRQGVEGTVLLYALIQKDGRVASVRVVRSLDPRLDESAVQALLRWEFRPATRNGHPVDLEALVQIPFALAPRPF